MTEQDFLTFVALLLANVIFFFIPIAMILRKMGLSRAWLLLLFTGPLMIVGLWVLAIRGWPSLVPQSTAN